MSTPTSQSARRGSGAFRPGQIVLARPYLLESFAARGNKSRPVILVHRTLSQWLCVALTTLPCYLDGSLRAPVPHPFRVGLTRESFLWGECLTPVSAIDIDRVLGYVEPDLAELVIAWVGLYGNYAAGLRLAASRHGESYLLN